MALAQGQPIKYDDINNLSNTSVTTSGNIICNGNISVPNGNVTANQYYGGVSASTKANITSTIIHSFGHMNGTNYYYKFLTYTSFAYYNHPTIINILGRNGYYTLYLKLTNEGAVDRAYYRRLFDSENYVVFYYRVPTQYNVELYASLTGWDRLNIMSIQDVDYEKKNFTFTETVSTTATGVAFTLIN